MFRRCRALLFFLSAITAANAQSIKDAFPDLESLSPEVRTGSLKSQFFKRPQSFLSVSSDWPEWLNPKSREWIFALEVEASPSEERGYVEVVSRSADDFFVVDRSPYRKERQEPAVGFRAHRGGGANVYHITPGHVDHVLTLMPGDGLFSSQVGVSRWKKKYDVDGKLTELTAWRVEGGIWDLYSTTTYEYWPDSRILQSMTERRTSSSGFGAAVSVFKFDEKGKQIDGKE